MEYQGLRAGVDAGLDLALDGEISIDHLARGFTAGVIGGCLANQIGAAYGKAHIDGITHKIMHATAGAFTGIILDEKGDPMAGAAAGALGAFVAETCADMFKPEKPTFQSIKAKEEELGRSLSEAEFKELYQAEMKAYDTSVSRTHDFAKLTAATTALFAGQDVTVAIGTSALALDNNFLILAYAGITIASVGYTAYDVYKTFENEGPEAALIKLGVNATLFAVGGIAVKGGSVLVRKAVAEILARNPGLQLALGSLVETMLISAEKVMATNAGQKVAAGVAKMEAPLVKSIDKASEAFDKLRGKVSGKTTNTANNITPTPLLEAPKMVKHHVFNVFRGTNPQTQKYRDFFIEHGIKIDDYCIKISENTHKSIIHAKGRDWTNAWKQFIDTNPTVNTTEVYQFAGKLMDQYNVSYVPLTKYK